MSALFAKLQADLNVARKAQDKARTLVIGTTISEAKNRKIELRRDLTDDDVLDVIQKSVKRRRESIELFLQGGRDELAAREQGEIDLLSAYLPAAASDEELRAAVVASISGGATAIGAVMGAVLPKFKGRADGSQISAIAREELAKRG